MDSRDEVRRFKWILIVGIVFLVAVYNSYSELRYRISGREVEARLIRATDVSTGYRRSGRERRELVVEYQFTDTDGTVRKETDSVPTSWTIDRSGPLMIEAIPRAAGWSRLSGDSAMVWVYIFLASLAAMGHSFFRFWQYYKS